MNTYDLLKDNDVYIFGYGKLGLYLQNLLNRYHIDFCGFIDNKATGTLKISNLKNKKAFILIASINYMYEIAEHCKNLGFCNFIVFPLLIKLFPELETFNDAFNGLFIDYEKNKAEYDNLYLLFEDKQSQEVLNGIIEFRKTADYTVFNRIKSNESEQYFNSLIPLQDAEILVDGGAYIGDSAEAFIAFNPNYKKIYCFEPDDKNYDKMLYNLKKYKNIEFYKKGISDLNKQVFFSNDSTDGAKIVSSAKTVIDCIALDNIVQEDRVMIKLDIEGSEPDALKGAKRLIQHNSILAICVYHKPNHLYEIPKLIKSINSNYRFYLRHYSATIFDTVLYAIPIL